MLWTQEGPGAARRISELATSGEICGVRVSSEFAAVPVAGSSSPRCHLGRCMQRTCRGPPSKHRGRRSWVGCLGGRRLGFHSQTYLSSSGFNRFPPRPRSPMASVSRLSKANPMLRSNRQHQRQAVVQPGQRLKGWDPGCGGQITSGVDTGSFR